MSTIIKLRCIDQVLTFESTPVIASGGLEEDALQVSFCSKWDGLAKTAVFWLPEAEEEAYHVPLDLADSCKIPREVLAKDGVFYFGIFGVSEDGRQRTTQALRYVVVKGAITSGTKPSDPTPDIYTQLLARYAEVLVEADAVVAESQKVVQAAENVQAEAEASARAAAASLAAAQSSADAAAAAQAAAQQTADQSVPNTRKVNGKALSEDITLAVEDLGAVPAARKVNGKALSSDISLTASDVDARPNTWMPTAAATGALAKDGSNTMTGDLMVEKAVAGVFVKDPSQNGIHGKFHQQGTGVRIVNTNGTDNGYASIIVNSPTVNNLQKVLQLMYGSSLYNILHAGNVGDYALKKDGSNAMTGNLLLEKAGGISNVLFDSNVGSEVRFAMWETTAAMLVRDERGTASRERAIHLKGHTSSDKVDNALLLVDKYYGTTKEYPILHTGNLSANGVARIETGSYVGTGTTGSASPTSLTFPFEPKMLIVTRVNPSVNYENQFMFERFIWVKGVTEDGGNTYGSYGERVERHYSTAGNTISWYATPVEAAEAQFNESGFLYHYIALG